MHDVCSTLRDDASEPRVYKDPLVGVVDYDPGTKGTIPVT